MAGKVQKEIFRYEGGSGHVQWGWGLEMEGLTRSCLATGVALSLWAPDPGGAATYHLDCAGQDIMAGTSAEAAWRTVADFHPSITRSLRLPKAA